MRRRLWVDGQAIVEYEVCLLNPEIGPVDINVQANVPPIPGITIVPGGGFDATGSATVTLPDLVGDPNCATLTLTLNVSAGVPPGTTVLIDLENDATSCDDHCGDVLLVLEECKGDTCEGLITVDHECRQKSEISWFDHITLYYQGFPTKNLNDPNCCVTWEYINGIPVLPCPRPNWAANQNFTPMNLPNGQHYKVTINCGDCQYVEEGYVNCGPGHGGEGGGLGREADSRTLLDGVDNDFATIYPNPATNEIAIRLKSDADATQQYSLQIVDALGRPVMLHSLLGSTQWQLLDISSFTPGVYAWYLLGEGNEKVVEKGKIVVIR